MVSLGWFVLSFCWILTLRCCGKKELFRGRKEGEALVSELHLFLGGAGVGGARGRVRVGTFEAGCGATTRAPLRRSETRARGPCSPVIAPSLGFLVTTWRSRKNPQHHDRMPVKAMKPEPDPTSYTADETKRTSEGTRRGERSQWDRSQRVIGPSWRPPMSGPRAATSPGTALRNGACHTA